LAKTGTKEWAGDTVNIQIGCENGCRYCYARHNAVEFRKYCKAEDWPNPVINQKKVDRNYGLYADGVMFPSTHDITPKNISECLCVLRKLLDAGNKVLIVSKPSWECITVICEALQEYTQQILFRFTIGSMHDDVLSFWEPGAPNYDERLACLKYAYTKRFSTSVNCEPYLDGDVIDLYCRIKPWTTHNFWVGLLREYKQRVDASKISAADYAKFVTPLLKAQAMEEITKIYHQLKNERLVKWKDSIREALNLETS